MNNRDMPVGPCGKIEVKPPKGSYPLGSYATLANGLTKREHFAGMAMQAMITKFGNACDRNIKDAVQLADELLRELEK